MTEWPVIYGLLLLCKILSKQVNFLTKLVALKPGKTVQEMIKNVMQGKDEGAEDTSDEDEKATASSGIAGRVSSTHYKLPVTNLFTIYIYMYI